MSRPLKIYQLTALGYEEARGFQRECVAALWESGRDEGVLILLEHPPVITIGRSGTDRNVLASKAALEAAGVFQVFETNRGGDVTYHGPGQIVGYPIIPLIFHGKDVHAYLRRIESVLMAVLREYGIEADRLDGYTGVWTPKGKIASIGVAVSHWITSHGFALNVAPNLDHFKLIHPCGLVGIEITSMKDLLGSTPARAEVEERIIAHFCAEFEFGETRMVAKLPVNEEKT